MLILGIETTGDICSVSLLGEGEKVFVKSSHDRLNHLKEITFLLQQIMRENNIELKDIDAIAVSAGPGSFTGMRIGVSTARAISQVTGTPCLSIDSIEAMARGFDIFNNEEIYQLETIVCPVIDARQNQVYSCAIYRGESVLKTDAYRGEQLADILIDAAESRGVEHILLIGDAKDEIKDEIISRIMFISGERKIDIIAVKKTTLQDAKSVARMGKALMTNKQQLAYDELLPKYIRKPEAQRRLEERLKS